MRLHFSLRFVVLGLVLASLLLGCSARPPSNDSAPVPAPEPAARAADPSSPPKLASTSVTVKRVPAGKNVWLEIEGKQRRVAVEAIVCLREGYLEQLMCRRRTKEHEAILSADMDARDIHKALLLTGVEPGSVVKYEPKFQPPKGPRIKVTLRYEEKGKTVTVAAQEWVRDARTKKPLHYDWVFAGSQLLESADAGEPPVYAANSGDVICVSNFPDALLDLPINSPQDNSELVFEAFTQHIPPIETKVTVILEPVADAGKK